MNISKKDNREKEQKKKLINGIKGYLGEKMDEIILIKSRLCFRNNLLNDQVIHRVFINVICIIVIIISLIK